MYVGAGDKDMGIRSEGRRGAGGMEMVCCYKMCITRAMFILFITERRGADSARKGGGMKGW